jgi:ketosteroid isomerase-like protein
MQADKQTASEIQDILNTFGEAFVNRNKDRVLSLFAADADVTFWGSETIEEAIGRERLSMLLDTLFARDKVYAFEWQQPLISSAGPVAWMMSDVIMRSVSDDGQEDSFPYRLSGVFEMRGDRWYWMQFHGSEPVEEDE